MQPSITLPNHERHGKYDAIVVGARCAGAATALGLARRGLSVLVVDREHRGADTLSTHALMRGGVLQLQRLGVLDTVRASGAPAIRTVTFDYGGSTLEVPVKPKSGVDALYAPRRHVLDPILADAARDAGATVRYGARVLDLLTTPAGRVRGIVVDDPERGQLEISAGIVIGADGVRSMVARRVAAPVAREGAYATACIYTYATGPIHRGYRWLYGPGLYAGIIPTNDDRSCVFVGTTERRFREQWRRDLPGSFVAALRELSPLVASEVTRGDIGPLRGYAGRSGFLRRAWGPGWALVGDAGYYKDPCTAHGMTDALRDAELLARAVAQGTPRALAEYEEIRDDLSIPFFDVTERIASMRWDLQTLPDLHEAAAEATAREVRWLTALSDDDDDLVPSHPPRRRPQQPPQQHPQQRSVS